MLYILFNMEKLIKKSERKLKQLTKKHHRSIFTEINWDERLVVLLGHRGTGKTTLLLQNFKSNPEHGIFLSLDDFYFETNRLISTIEVLYDKGYRTFYLDEVHRYLNWSRDIKQIYDDFDDAKIIATGSSILDISKGTADLSRRAVVHNIQGLSYREYLMFEYDVNFPQLELSQILNNHQELSSSIKDQIPNETAFKNYLENGYYPFYLEGKQSYFGKLQQTTHLVIDTDIAPFESLNYSTVRTLKKLLYVISQTAPFKPNISKLAERLQTQRNTILKLLDILAQAKIINLLKSDTSGISYLQKPEKIYLENTNLIHLFAQGKPNTGTLRETFFFNQLAYRQGITSSKYGDFMVDETYTFEIGGPSKSVNQIRGVPLAYLALDIEMGTGNKIPLWLFGFLY